MSARSISTNFQFFYTYAIYKRLPVTASEVFFNIVALHVFWVIQQDPSHLLTKALSGSILMIFAFFKFSGISKDTTVFLNEQGTTFWMDSFFTSSGQYIKYYTWT